MLMTFLAPFFPRSSPGLKISPHFQGLIFAAFPAGSVIVSSFVGKFMQTLGTRNTVVIGLASMGLFTILFGFTPYFGGPSVAIFMTFAFCYGAGSTLAETGVYAIVSTAFSDHVGKVLAMAETVTGAGSMAGPFFGGVVYNLLEVSQLGSVSFGALQFQNLSTLQNSISIVPRRVWALISNLHLRF